MSRVICGVAVLLLTAAPSFAEPTGEERFFQDCPRRRFVRLHDERRPWDLHAILYTGLGASEVEALRLADWLIDLPLPGRPLRPFERAADAIRAGYHRLPPWLVIERIGEFVDALQLRELSLGDATSTYSASVGDLRGPGSGMLVRVDKLVDWLQHVTGDLNRLSGRAVMRPQGLVTWSGPGRVVDGAQSVLARTFHRVGVVVARTLEGSLTTVEAAGEGLVNLGYRRPHQETTVFLRLPREVLRAHELWVLERHPQLILGPPELFLASTHAALGHRRRQPALWQWSDIDRLTQNASAIIVMTTTRVIARAPDELKPYVVPAAWILAPATIDNPTSRP